MNRCGRKKKHLGLVLPAIVHGLHMALGRDLPSSGIKGKAAVSWALLFPNLFLLAPAPFWNYTRDWCGERPPTVQHCLLTKLTSSDGDMHDCHEGKPGGKPGEKSGPSQEADRTPGPIRHNWFTEESAEMKAGVAMEGYRPPSGVISKYVLSVNCACIII